MMTKFKNIRSQSARSSQRTAKAVAPNAAAGPFQPGAIVLVTLNNPREKLWGAILGLDPAGLSLHGIELSSFEDATNMVVAGESLNAGALFFPMHRVERVQLDLPEGEIPSLSQRFTHRTGLTPADALAKAMSDSGAGASHA
jgi:hypothetical protein